MKNFIKKSYTKKDLILLSTQYKYIVKATDAFLSGWGNSTSKKHIQVILCKDEHEKELILNDVYKDNTLQYVNWYPLSNSFYQNILNLQYKYDVSLRNDWTRIYN